MIKVDGFGHKVVTVVVRRAGWFSFGFWCAHGRLLWCCSKSETIPGPSNTRRDRRERSKGGWRYHPAGALGKNTRQFFSFRMTDEQRYPPNRTLYSWHESLRGSYRDNYHVCYQCLAPKKLAHFGRMENSHIIPATNQVQGGHHKNRRFLSMILGCALFSRGGTRTAVLRIGSADPRCGSLEPQRKRLAGPIRATRTYA